MCLFIDLLISSSKVVQSDEVDILTALTSVLKTSKETKKLSSKHIEEQPAYAAT